MKKIFLLFCVSCISLFYAQSLAELRKSFVDAYKTKDNAKSFSLLTQNANKTSTQQAYQAAARIVEAKFEKPEQRKKLLKEGAMALEDIIKKEPDNAESRLIRLAIQENLPKFLGYNHAIVTDKNFLMKEYTSQEPAVKTLIKNFVQQSKTFTPEEKQRFK